MDETKTIDRDDVTVTPSARSEDGPQPPAAASGDAGPPPAQKAWPLWLRIAVVLLLAAALALPLLLFREELGRIFAMRDQVVAEVQGAGPWGPLVIVGLAIGQTIIAPIPGQVVNFVSAYVYGFWPGALYSWVGLVLGTSMAMLLARHAGRPLVERIVGRSLLDRVDRAAAGKGLSFFFLFFLVPGLPDDVLCFVAGLTSLPLRALVLISAVARIPGLVGSAWLGAYAHSLPPWGWLVLGIAGVGATYLAWKYGEQAQAWFLKWMNAR